MELQTTTIDIKDAMQKFEPKIVLVAYKSEGQSRYYLEQSDVTDGVPTGFHPASVKEIKSLFSSVTAAESGYIKCPGLFPRNILHLDITGGDFRLVWWRQAKRQWVKFDKELKMRPVNMRVPAMIYDANRSGAKVYCIKTSAQCGTIYEAPYMNIMGDDSVCFGNVKINIPAITDLNEIMEQYEQAFWCSEFTDSGSTDYLKLWKDLSKGQHKSFPLMSLKPHKKYKTIKQFLEQ